MSFSGDVKNELAYQQLSSAGHCQIAEIAAIITVCGKVVFSAQGHVSLRIRTENLYVAHKFCVLIRKCFKVRPEVKAARRMSRGENAIYTLWITNHEEAAQILREAKLLTDDQDIAEQMSLVSNQLIRKTCCRRAFLRGIFLACGTISDPHKFYQLEIVCNAQAKAQQLRELMQTFELEAGINMRKGRYVVYLKEGSQVLDMLNVMEAHRCLMAFENVRILRGISNEINRRVNCEAANIRKTVSASMRQIEDIRYIQEHMDLNELPQALRETALLRLEYPETPLQELGTMLDPPVGKSGINHRLQKLGELAGKLRAEEG